MQVVLPALLTYCLDEGVQSQEGGAAARGCAATLLRSSLCMAGSGGLAVATWRGLMHVGHVGQRCC